MTSQALKGLLDMWDGEFSREETREKAPGESPCPGRDLRRVEDRFSFYFLNIFFNKTPRFEWSGTRAWN